MRLMALVISCGHRAYLGWDCCDRCDLQGNTVTNIWEKRFLCSLTLK